MGRRAHLIALALAALTAAVAPGVAAARARAHAGASDLHATIRRTAYGTPHIQATTFAGLGYGYGYAFAQDDICPMADDYITVDAQRSRFFGPQGTYLQRGNGAQSTNLNSDFFWQQIIDSKIIDRLVSQPPPFGPEPEMRDLVRGYVAGYDRYLSDVGGSNGVSDPTCRGKPWVRPITTADAYRRFYQLVLIASSGVAVDGIGEAQPPTPSLPLPLKTARSLDPHTLAMRLSSRLPLRDTGSNAIAVGRAGTRDHRHGLLLGNPHFPWLGTERFYQAQLEIPGRFDVEGASLFGVPLVLIGHTPTMAWSHTVSTAFRFTPYQLTLVPGSPTTYLVDGTPTPMTSRTVTVQVRQPDGSIAPQSRTLWSTRWGPVFDNLLGIPLPWTPATAFAMADANATNFRVFNHFFQTDRARSAQQELDILKRYQGIPWVNTLVADKQGNALYADIGTVPNVPDAKAQSCDTAAGAATFEIIGLPILDGSRSQCAWDNDPDAVQPGIFGPSHEPHLFRSDYVTNSNDSYWLSNPHQPLTGFARIIGSEATPRSLRTRIGLIMTQARVSGTDGLGPAGFTLGDMERLVFSDRQYAGELLRDGLVAMCRGFPGGLAPTSSGPPVAVGDACDVLARWDLHENLGSKGAELFRRFFDHAYAVDPSGGRIPAFQSEVFSTPFDPNDPVNTPNGLNTASPTVRTALGDAIQDLQGAGIPLDAAPGDVQAVTRNGVRIPLHGGIADPNGDFNALTTSFTPGKGFAEPTHGSSYVQVVTWGAGPCPQAATILTYSLSVNPRSPHLADQTRLFSAKRWVTERFCDRDVLAHTLSTTTLAAGSPTRTTTGASTRRRRPAVRRRAAVHRRAARRRTHAHFTG